ncbi:hypothetical protein [Consotaella salsifontis]|uniref:Phage terminase, small subunit, putative, P27 family n=1 Tax=Consotaella salsifontis TaxID=1365950 RepID=A0A1T4R4K5_9HYPH|nr:hypothetical protein [Consotaella salsifontis]SKA10980.1 hypothetical protein SAMN05428963_10624 [Consotaella salsifontis]
MKRGPKSAASLALVAPLTESRPLPPEDLTDDQQGEWRAVVRRMPADWFPRETHGILKAFCRHATTHRLISYEIDRYEAEWLKDEDGLKRLDKLTAMRERESRAMIATARALRITKHSQIRPETAGRATRGSFDGRRPWDTDEDRRA